MAPERTKDYPSLVFIHSNCEFRISVVPDGPDVVLHIADQYGRIMLPYPTRITGANARRRRDLNRRRIDAAITALRNAIEELEDAAFLRFLETPRAANDFQWTFAELESAAKIDWSVPAATFMHEGHNFAIGAFATDERMVLLLKDADAPFDAPLSIPRASILSMEMKGADPLVYGVKTIVERIRTWSTSRTAAFVEDTPRLTARMN
jgi:hypothetical protein